MKKINKIKKEVKKNKKSVDSKINKRKNNKDVDLWKEIRSNLKPLSNAYNKFKEKRKYWSRRRFKLCFFSKIIC